MAFARIVVGAVDIPWIFCLLCRMRHLDDACGLVLLHKVHWLKPHRIPGYFLKIKNCPLSSKYAVDRGFLNFFFFAFEVENRQWVDVRLKTPIVVQLCK